MKELTLEEKKELFFATHEPETNASTKEEFIEICHKCNCTEEEIDDLLQEKEKYDAEQGFFTPWEYTPIPYLGEVERLYYFDENNLLVDRVRGCTYEELGLTPPRWYRELSMQSRSTL